MHLSKGNNNLIISLTEETRIGERVIDKEDKIIGRIFDIFGPVTAPYASIKLNNGVELEKVDGKPVFLSITPSKKRQRSKRRRKSR